MVVANRPKSGRTKDGRYRVYDSTVGHLVYKTEAEMTPDDFERFNSKHPASPLPASAPSGAVVVEPVVSPAPAPLNHYSSNRYANDINWFEQRINALAEVVRDPREADDRRGKAMTDIEQYREAVEVRNEAALLPAYDPENVAATSAWFVSSTGEFSVMIPPVVPGSYDRTVHKLRSSDHYYHAKDPVEIVVLRRAAARSGGTIHEKPIGTFPIMDYAHSQFEGWGDWDFYSQRQGKRYRPV